MQTVPLKDIRIDGGTQPRVSINEDTVADYADGYRRGVVLPAVDVFWDGAEFWLADGFHRFHGMKAIGAGSIRATVHQGTRREAVLFSAGANQGHGLQRSNDDKRKAIETLIDDAEWGKWNDREISRRVGVSHTLVGDVRRGISNRNKQSLVHCTSEPQVSRRYTNKHGTDGPMEVSKIGRTARQPKSGAVGIGFETSRGVAIDGAPDGLLKKYSRKPAADQAQSAVHALQGIASAMAKINAADLAEHPDAARWHRAITDVVAVLRAFARPLSPADKTKDVA